MGLISRYIFREAFVSTTLVMAVLLVIFMSNQFAETLGEAATDELPRDAVLNVLGLQFLRFLALLAPIGLLLGVLLGLARLNRDSEMAALAACGVGPARLIKPIGFLSLLVAIGVGWLSLIAAPAASRAIEEIRLRAQERMELGAFVPDRFTSISSGATVIYAREVMDDQLRGVFIWSEVDERSLVVVAEQGETVGGDDGDDISLTLRNGSRYEGVPGEANFFLAEFAEQGMPIHLEQEELVTAIASRETRELMQSADPESRAELQWRVAAPLSVLILSLLAVPLGRSSPREGKYARVGVGLLIYMIYANTLSIARVWVERDLVPAWLGTWWVHGLLGLLALAMLAQQSGLWARPAEGSRARHEPAR